MSYRIHRAIGWGMPADAFRAALRLPMDGRTMREVLERRFREAGDAGLTLPREEHRRLFYAEAPRPPPVMECRLLALSTTLGGRREAGTGDAADLFEFVGNPDGDTDVLFFPNLSRRAAWYRHDDDLDYAFEMWRGGEAAGPSEPRFVRDFPRFGFHPWTNDLMLADGTPVPWTHHVEVEGRPDWLPAVPSEIRWYLTELGVTDRADVNGLRPMLAQWWS